MTGITSEELDALADAAVTQVQSDNTALVGEMGTIEKFILRQGFYVGFRQGLEHSRVIAREAMTKNHPPKPAIPMPLVEFEGMRAMNLLKSEQAYDVGHLDGSTGWAWSPDGTGCYWYESREERVESHGV